MNEGSRRLRMTIAGILGVAAITINSIDEQIPPCIRAIPAKAVAMASCPLQHPIPHYHDEVALTPITGQLTGTSQIVSISYGELTNATPESVVASDCPAKAQAPAHVEGKDEAPTEEMPFLLRNAAANFFNQQYVPRRRNFIQLDQSNDLIVLMPPSCLDKDQAPLHLERKDEFALAVNTTITPDTGFFVLNGQTADLLTGPPDKGDGMELAYKSAPCPEKDQAPLHIEPEGGRPTFRPTTGIRMVSTQSQFFENPAPVFIPSRRSNLVTVLTQYPEAPKLA
jgi:hypothetical protein